MSARPTTTARGNWAEDTGLAFLEQHGLALLARNYRCRHGEVDLVMRDGETLAFVEVRYRASGAWVSGAESVDGAKRRRLLATAEHYLQRHREHVHRACRLDVLDVSGARHAPRVEWIQDAFEA